MKDGNYLRSNGVDLDYALSLLGDMEMYNSTMEDFLSSFIEKLSNLKKFKEAHDMPNYAILVHSLKSDCKYLGFMKLADISLNHEMKSKDNDQEYVDANFNGLLMEASNVLNIAKNYLGVKEATPKKDNNVVSKIVESGHKAILVVDDSNIVRNFIEKIFTNKFDVLIANEGEEAIDIIKENGQEKIACMLLDLNMPNVDGFQVLDYLKDNDLFKGIPVSIITGNNNNENVSKAFKYPIVDLLAKPFNERDVERVVEKTIAFHESQN